MSIGLPQIPAYSLPSEAQLPVARAPFMLERDRAVLLVHDMQRYFVRPFIADQQPITGAIDNMTSLIAAARTADVPVVYTAQKINQDRRDRGLQAELWGPGMHDLNEHQPILSQLAPGPNDIVLTKHRYSAFQRSNLEHFMRVRGRDQLIICGIYAHIGCMLTAADAFMRDIEPFFVADAVADFSKEKHDLAVSYVADVCGVPLTTRMTLNVLEAHRKAVAA
ncbi:isochorismatase family protein [Brucellaceae bacterium D45D]